MITMINMITTIAMITLNTTVRFWRWGDQDPNPKTNYPWPEGGGGGAHMGPLGNGHPAPVGDPLS